MTTIIGNVLPDGRVKYIRCNDNETMRVTARLLKAFYSRQNRVDALLELGNIECLGPSPYGRSKGTSDELHCIAAVRDCGANAQVNKPEFITGKDIFLKANCPAFLFEDGHWLLAWKREFIRINSCYDIPLVRTIDRYGLSYISISRDEERSKKNGAIQEFSFTNWSDMCKQAVSNGDTYYVFRCKKLIATINPEQTT